MSFVHLHNHTEYSLVDGTLRLVDEKGKPSEFLHAISKSGMPAAAITDHGNLYGAIEFYTTCREMGIKPIIGCEVYVTRGNHTDRAGTRKDNFHFVLLARNFEGYQNLMALSSKAFLQGFYYDPRIDKNLLARHSKGLIGLSGCLKSEVSRLLVDGNLEAAVKVADEYSQILGRGNFFLEIMDHGLEGERQAIKGLIEISKRTGIPLVATNDTHYLRKDDWDVHEARICISTGKLITDANRLRFETHEFHFKTAPEMARLFSYAPDSVARTLEIAHMCDLEIPVDQLLLPHFEPPDGLTAESYLENLCLEGLKQKKIDSSEYGARLKYELSVIRRMGFSAYFLIVWDFIKYARSQSIPVGPGRGSGAGSLVAYALDITRVDPIKHGLLFERFLNPDRRTMPDLDIDFSDEGRDRVIDYVRQKYGAENVAQIITFGSMQARAAIRDVGRVLNVPLGEVDRFAKLVPAGSTIYQAIQSAHELRSAIEGDPHIKKLFDLAQRIEGLKRHTGVHAAGTVITKEAVMQYTPLSKGASSSVVTTQYDDHGLLKLGLLKIDFLGLRTLTVIDHAVAMIRQGPNPDFDIERIPLDDEKTFELLRSARTLGVFQLESSGMRDLLRKLKPTNFEDIAAVVALFRPGPMQSGMLDEFVARKHGHKAIRYDTPLLEPILKETYGTMVFQEQIMDIAKNLANFTPGEADVLRKAMGKKIPEEMERPRTAFLAGCKANKIKERMANKIYNQMATFGGYGFNKSHATAYALLAYQTAYLKANYLVEFMTGLLSSEIGRSAIGVEGKENKLATYLDESREMGIEVRGPDVNHSECLFSIERDGNKNGRIRCGLLAIKNVGSGAAESIVNARSREKPFASLDEFCMRVDLRQANKKVLESLAKAGAMDCLLPEKPKEEARSLIGLQLDSTLQRQASIKEDIKAGQGLLFQSEEMQSPGRALTGSSRQEQKGMSENELLQQEKEVLGFYLSGHPLRRYQADLYAAATHTIEALPRTPSARVRVAGMITQVKKMFTREGNKPWARASLEDLTGEINVLVFPRSYEAGLGSLLKTNDMVVVQGRLSIRGEAVSAAQEPELIAEETIPLEMAVERWGKALTIYLSTVGLEEEHLEEIRAVLRKHPGVCPVYLKLQTSAHGTVFLETRKRVRLFPALFEDLEKVLGSRAWKIER